MPQVCKVCVHPQRAAIDAELMRSWERSLRAIAAEYGLSKDAVFRHEARHLPANAYSANRGKPNEPAEAEPRQVVAVLSHEKEPAAVLNNQNNSNREEAEARQIVELVEQEKEPEPDEAPEPATAPQLWTPEQWAESYQRAEELSRLIQIQLQKLLAGGDA